MDKVFIAAPSSSIKNYCLDRYADAARAMKCDFIISDNTPHDANALEYKSRGIAYKWCDPEGKNKYEIITSSQNQLREVFLNSDYTHWLMIETDIIAPSSIKDRLLAAKKPVVGCSYFLYKGMDTVHMSQSMSLEKASIGMSRHLRLKEAFMEVDGGVKRVYGMGLGCVMIERSVIERIEFRCAQDALTVNEAYSDSFFYNDLVRNKIPAYMDTLITVKHMNHDLKKIQG